MKQPVIVLGLGRTGLSVLRALVPMGERIIAMDTRSPVPGLATLEAAFPEVDFVPFDPDLLKQAAYIVLSPGVPRDLPALQQPGLVIIGDIQLFSQLARAPIIGITGTNGKSTVTALVGELCRAAGVSVEVGGNFGTPALDLLSRPLPEFYILELSSFQLESTYQCPMAVASILNLAPDHLDRYSLLEDYYAAKHRIYKHAQIKIYHRDMLNTQPADLTQATNVGLSEPGPDEFGIKNQSDNKFLAFGEQILLNTSDLKLKGRHNWANALAALAIGKALNLPMASMLETLKNFTGLSHRCQFVVNKNQVDWINDSKATNVAATAATLQGIGENMQGKIILIAGGKAKESDFSPLNHPLIDYARAVILMGEDADLIAESLDKNITIKKVETLDQAVDTAEQLAEPGDTVLLAPACTSFDQFQDFEQRGNYFMQCVQAGAR